ncbi:MAG: hypothetical protein BWY26_00796 [Elusimicrobia bacterium ADurb.Bin231]|nr:MAG: hypothetical protein BWY26_00796 [Elusimicrobia bacterium ADurb.Bin231]
MKLTNKILLHRKKRAQGMTEYVLMVFLCVLAGWVGTSFFQTHLKKAYDNSSKPRSGLQGVYP